MKLNKILVLSAVFLIHSLSFAATVSDGTKLPPELLSNLPPGETVEPLPEAVLQDPPVYLDVDSKGNVYARYPVRDKAGNYKLLHELVTPSTLKELSSQQEVILQNMEDIDLPGLSSGQGSSAASTSNCPLPSAFTISGNSDGPVMGGATVVNTYRPAEATTQWLVFDFYTNNYRGNGSHMPMALFHSQVVHGWGAFIGDNHQSVEASCGNSALFNSQIEGWTQYPPQPDPQEESLNWQSVTFNGPNSCGNEMYDGPFIFQMTPMPRYRFEMQASTGHWVAYRIMELNDFPSLHWQVLTDWRVIDVDTGSWKFGGPNWSFYSFPQGIWIAAIPALAGVGPWSIIIVGSECGWF